MSGECYSHSVTFRHCFELFEPLHLSLDRFRSSYCLFSFENFNSYWDSQYEKFSLCSYMTCNHRLTRVWPIPFWTVRGKFFVAFSWIVNDLLFKTTTRVEWNCLVSYLKISYRAKNTIENCWNFQHLNFSSLLMLSVSSDFGLNRSNRSICSTFFSNLEKSPEEFLPDKFPLLEFRNFSKAAHLCSPLT